MAWNTSLVRQTLEAAAHRLDASRGRFARHPGVALRRLEHGLEELAIAHRLGLRYLHRE